MSVLVIAKTTFQTVPYTNVTNIAYAAGTDTYTLTLSGGTTQSFSGATYFVSILWK